MNTASVLQLPNRIQPGKPLGTAQLAFTFNGKRYDGRFELFRNSHDQQFADVTDILDPQDGLGAEKKCGFFCKIGRGLKSEFSIDAERR